MGMRIYSFLTVGRGLIFDMNHNFRPIHGPLDAKDRRDLRSSVLNDTTVLNLFLSVLHTLNSLLYRPRVD